MVQDRCRRTKGHPWQIDGVDWLRRWLTDGLDERIATDVLFTEGQTAAQTAARIAGRCSGRDDGGRKETT